MLHLLGRENPLFNADLCIHRKEILESVKDAKILVVGAAGSIGKAVAIELFRRDPALLHLVDISENNMVELVREIRSSLGYIKGEFKTFAVDYSSVEFEALLAHHGPYDYVFNLAALKHVRSEKDPYTLMRMFETNIFATIKLVEEAKKFSAQKYFCVSTDKAASPVNLMGASKRIMELYLMEASFEQSVSMARFANVAFSDGSLLHGFNQRFLKNQPISAPRDVRRYFITPQESGELCLLSGFLGYNRDIFFPKLNENLHMITFSDIATNYLHGKGFEPYECYSEDEARARANDLIQNKKWPCYFFETDTTGEKDFEEFYTDTEELDMVRFETVGVIKNNSDTDRMQLAEFSQAIRDLRMRKFWEKRDIVRLVENILPEFTHIEKNKYLDERM